MRVKLTFVLNFGDWQRLKYDSTANVSDAWKERFIT